MEFESNIIGCLLLKPDLIKEICIPTDAFKTEEARISLKIIIDQYKKIKSVSLVAISETYKSLFKNSTEAKNITDYLCECMNTEATAAHFEYYQEQLLNNYIEVEIMNVIRKYQSNSISREDMLKKIHELENITMAKKNEYLTGQDLYAIIRHENKRLKFRFDKLTTFANIQEHDFPIIAARPGTGKSAFALNLMDDLSTKYNCIYFNMEMSEEQIYRRIVSMNSNIDMKYLSNPASSYQDEKIKEMCYEVAKKKIKIITGPQNIRTIRSRIVKEAKNGHTVAFIDYVGFVSGTDPKQSGYERTTAITKELRQMALEYDCTIFLIAQINRKSEKNKDKRPQLSDLKESGELEQSGTTVIMLHNADPYSKNKIANIELIIGKNRNGGVGIINFDYDKAIQRFEESKKE